MRKKIFLLLIIVLQSFTVFLWAQKKVVVMGSSTAVGTGASNYAYSWVGRLASYFRRNTNDGLDTTVTNIAIGGYNTYLEMPTTYSPPPSRPSPDATANVTLALSSHPDVVIINLPTNDITAGFFPKEIMDNFRFMYAAITAGGAKCFITTTQPRFLTDPQRETLKNLRDSIMLNFGNHAIDFFTPTADALYKIKPEYDSGDFTHYNDLGYSVVFNQVVSKQIFAANGALPLMLTDFQAQAKNNSVIIKWHADQEEANTFYEVQRSADGSNFETLYRQAAKATGIAADYSWTDQNPLPGKSFYRLYMIEPARQSFTKTVSVISKVSELTIGKLYADNGSLNLIAEIGVQKSQSAVISIINISGATVRSQTKYLTGPSDKIILPISGLASGQYFLSITGNENNHSVKAFNKQ